MHYPLYEYLCKYATIVYLSGTGYLSRCVSYNIWTCFNFVPFLDCIHAVYFTISCLIIFLVFWVGLWVFFVDEQAYTSQIAAMTMMALALGEDTLSSRYRREAIIDDLFNLPSNIF